MRKAKVDNTSLLEDGKGNMAAHGKRSPAIIATVTVCAVIAIVLAIVLPLALGHDRVHEESTYVTMLEEVSLGDYAWSCGEYVGPETTITKDTLSVCANETILILTPDVWSITRDALLGLENLLAVVVDANSTAQPEDCDFGWEHGRYKHVPVFRINTASPSLVSLPDTLFKTGYNVPILMYSVEEQNIKIEDRTLTCSGGYCVVFASFPEGEHAIGDMSINVVEWDEDQQQYGVPWETNEAIGLRIPYGVYRVSDLQYLANKMLQSVQVPATVKIIGACAFKDNTNLMNVELTSGTKEIGAHAFESTSIISLNVPGSVRNLGEFAFSSAGIRILTLSEGLETVGDYAFSENQITDVCIPASVRTVSSYAFLSCTQLDAVTFKEGTQLTEIGDGAFSGSGLTEFTIPSSVASIGTNPFAYCPSFVSLKSDNDMFPAHDDILISQQWKKLITFVCRGRTEYIIPQKIEEIGASAFGACKSLVSITFEQDSALRSIGDFAFDMTGLTEITIPPSVETIGSGAFSSTNLDAIVFPPSALSFGMSVFFGTPIGNIDAPGTAEFDPAFLQGIPTECAVCFFNCNESPEIREYPKITVATSPTNTCQQD